MARKSPNAEWLWSAGACPGFVYRARPLRSRTGSTPDAFRLINQPTKAFYRRWTQMDADGPRRRCCRFPAQVKNQLQLGWPLPGEVASYLRPSASIYGFDWARDPGSVRIAETYAPALGRGPSPRRSGFGRAGGRSRARACPEVLKRPLARRPVDCKFESAATAPSTGSLRQAQGGRRTPEAASRLRECRVPAGTQAFCRGDSSPPQSRRQ